jgi:hypothetical protein
MNRYAASARCQQLWRHLGLPFTRIRRRSVVDRYEVGYVVGGGRVTIMGAGPSWEQAFERATKEGK